MPRYFFHLRDQDDLHDDREGMDLPDLKAALDEVLRTDRELSIQPAGTYGLEFEIADVDGKTLLRVPVQERRRNPSLAAPGVEDERRRSTDKKGPLH